MVVIEQATAREIARPISATVAAVAIRLSVPGFPVSVTEWAAEDAAAFDLEWILAALPEGTQIELVRL